MKSFNPVDHAFHLLEIKTHKQAATVRQLTKAWRNISREETHLVMSMGFRLQVVIWLQRICIQVLQMMPILRIILVCPNILPRVYIKNSVIPKMHCFCKTPWIKAEILHFKLFLLTLFQIPWGDVQRQHYQNCHCPNTYGLYIRGCIDLLTNTAAVGVSPRWDTGKTVF